MREVFYEEASFIHEKKSESRKYNTYRILSIVSFALCAVVFFAVYTVMQNLIYTFLHSLIPEIGLVAFGIIFSRMKNKFYVEYDYTFVSGSIRFAKVIKEIKRVRIAMFDCSSVINVGRFYSNAYKKYESMTDIVTYNLCANDKPSDGAEIFYILAMYEGQRSIFLLDCTEKFIAHVLQFSRKGIFEEDKN